MRKLAIGISALGLMVGTAPVTSAALFQDQMNSGTGWSKNESNTNNQTTFGYDYSADGIPEAPNTQVGDDATSGLKMEANLDGTVGSIFHVYPTGQNFTGDYQLRFDAWMEYGTAGTTEYLGGSIAYNGTSADVGGGGVSVFATGDGGSSNDYRQFNDAAFAGLLKSFERILPLREASDLISAEARERIHKLTSGVTARIFRLIETAAEEAVRAGKERLDAHSFGDNLVLPMTQTARRRGKPAQQQVGA